MNKQFGENNRIEILQQMKDKSDGQVDETTIKTAPESVTWQDDKGYHYTATIKDGKINIFSQTH